MTSAQSMNHEDVMADEALDTLVHSGDELGLFTPYAAAVEPSDLS